MSGGVWRSGLAVALLFAGWVGLAGSADGAIYCWRDSQGTLNKTSSPPPKGATIDRKACPNQPDPAAAEAATATSESNAVSATDVGVPGLQYISSKNSNKYHHPDCTFAQRISEKNRETFDTQAEAEATGLEPHSCVDKAGVTAAGRPRPMPRVDSSPRRGGRRSSGSSGSIEKQLYGHLKKSSWSKQARKYRQAVEKAKAKVARERKRLRRYRILQYSNTRTEMQQLKLEEAEEDLREAEEAYERFYDRARRAGVPPGWLRED